MDESRAKRPQGPVAHVVCLPGANVFREAGARPFVASFPQTQLGGLQSSAKRLEVLSEVRKLGLLPTSSRVGSADEREACFPKKWHLTLDPFAGSSRFSVGIRGHLEPNRLLSAKLSPGQVDGQKRFCVFARDRKSQPVHTGTR